MLPELSTTTIRLPADWLVSVRGFGPAKAISRQTTHPVQNQYDAGLCSTPGPGSGANGNNTRTRGRFIRTRAGNGATGNSSKNHQWSKEGIRSC